MKNGTLVLLVLAATIAGCAEPSPDGEPAGGAGTESTTTGATPEPPFELHHGLVGNATTRNESVRYFVEANGSVSVTVRLDDTTVVSEVLEGRKEWELPLEHGETYLNATIEGPQGEASENLTLVREAPLSLAIDWCYFHTPPQRITYAGEYWVDVDARPSEPLYLEQGGTHRPYFTVHDLMVLFETATDIPVETQWFASSNAFLVNKIDDVGNPPYWNFAVNDEVSPVGVSEAALEPGDRVDWFLVDSGSAPICP